MKNIHILPTDKPSRLFKFANELHLDTIPKDYYKKYNIYITSDEEIKIGDWFIVVSGVGWKLFDLLKAVKSMNNAYNNSHCKKIILTTDMDLIKDGVQAIDDEFLEWFVKNPSCESIQVINGLFSPMGRQVDPMELGQNHSSCIWKYKIIIPQEEPKQETSNIAKERAKHCMMLKGALNPKQETLEEAAERNCESITHPYCTREKAMFIKGSKWQADRMYSEEEMIEFSKWRVIYEDENPNNVKHSKKLLKEWYEQFKKK